MFYNFTFALTIHFSFAVCLSFSPAELFVWLFEWFFIHSFIQCGTKASWKKYFVFSLVRFWSTLFPCNTFRKPIWIEYSFFLSENKNNVCSVSTEDATLHCFFLFRKHPTASATQWKQFNEFITQLSVNKISFVDTFDVHTRQVHLMN